MKPGTTVYVTAWKPQPGDRFFARVKHSTTIPVDSRAEIFAGCPDKTLVIIPARPVIGKLAVGGPFVCEKNEHVTVVARELGKDKNERRFTHAMFSFRPLTERIEE